MFSDYECGKELEPLHEFCNALTHDQCIEYQKGPNLEVKDGEYYCRWNNYTNECTYPISCI